MDNLNQDINVNSTVHNQCLKRKNYLTLSLGYDSRADLIEALEFMIDDLKDEEFGYMFETDEWHYFSETTDESLYRE